MKTRHIARQAGLAASFAAALALSAPPSSADHHAEAEAAPKLTMGNGEANHIRVEGFSRAGRVLTFPEVKIADDGWLVLHPFRDGRPVGEIYVGATFVEKGTSSDVQVHVSTAPMPTAGTQFLVMLHSDVNHDELFDFVFVDERNVKDKAVFEGTTMIAHPISVP